MRRPLCLITLLYIGILSLFLALAPPQQTDYSALDRETVTITGRITAKEYKRSSTDGTISLLVTLDKVRWDTPVSQGRTGQDIESLAGNTGPAGKDVLPNGAVLPDIEGSVLVSPADGKTDPAALDASLPVGAFLSVRGELSAFDPPTNPGEFNAPLYYQILRTDFRLNDAEILRVSGSGNPVRNALYRFKRALAGILDRCLPETDAAVLRAMLLGEKGVLTEEIKTLYKESGIIHILAISGLHISLIGMGLYKILRKIRLPLTPSVFLAVTVMLLYGEMVGMSGSSFRAVCMFFLHMTALLLGRTYDILTGLSFAALLLLLNSGFLFSFTAVLGIAVLMPCFSSKTLKTLAVPCASLPVYLNFLYTFPLWSLVLNLVVIPLMTFVMLGGFLILLLGGISTVLGRMAAWPCRILLYFYYAVCNLSQTLPGHRLVPGAPSPLQTVLYIALLAAGVFLNSRVEEKREHAISAADLTQEGDPYGLLPAASGDRDSGGRQGRQGFRSKLRRYLHFHGIPELWKAGFLLLAVLILLYRPQNGFTLQFVDVGQGDGIYITADGTKILIDGGSSSKKKLGQYQLGPFLDYEAAGTIDLAILTHDDLDHCSGLIWLLENDRDIRRIVIADIPASGENLSRILELASERQIPVTRIARGESLRVRGRGLSQFVKRLRGNKSELALSCVHPVSGKTYEDANQGSVTLLLTYGNFSALLTGDLEEEGEKECLEYLKMLRNEANDAAKYAAQNAVKDELQRTGEDVSVSWPGSTPEKIPERITVLKCGHHGSKFATSAEWLDFLHPQYGVISCGEGNRYGHPAPETVERLRQEGCSILDTRATGWICFATDGKRLELRTFQEASFAAAPF